MATLLEPGEEPLLHHWIERLKERDTGKRIHAATVLGSLGPRAKDAVPAGAYSTVDSVIGQTTKVFMAAREPVTATKMSSLQLFPSRPNFS